MRSMGDSEYRYSPWTPERRKAASERSKAWWAEKRVREAKQSLEAECAVVREKMGLLGKIREKKREQLDRKERARAAYFAAENQASELQAAEDAIVGMLRVLRRHGLSGEVG
jgi:hypothetical protein